MTNEYKEGYLKWINLFLKIDNNENILLNNIDDNFIEESINILINNSVFSNEKEMQKSAYGCSRIILTGNNW